MKPFSHLLIVWLATSTLSATFDKYDVYIEYDQALSFRAGINYKDYGLYVRPIFDKSEIYDYYDDYYQPSRKGLELGINYNRKLFGYKRLEGILNIFGGNILSAVRSSDGLKYWDESIEIGIIPEFRFFKKASIIVSPLVYRYYMAVDKIGRSAYSNLNISTMSLWNMQLGLKFYL